VDVAGHHYLLSYTLSPCHLGWAGVKVERVVLLRPLAGEY